ncbi:hypothetical protein, partial [Dyella ginsengisoli]|uniref:hypothetical protein n=1 Tax=Dyella ginsengisoli TaxID=363848 RepID=UPI0019D6DEC1
MAKEKKMMMRWIVSIVLATMASAAATASEGASPAPGPSGVYAVRFCQGSCPPSANNVQRTGVLVLLDPPP